MQTAADVTLAGARAGVGKTYGLLYIPTLFLHYRAPANAIVFKARAGDLTKEGGITTKARRIYKPLGARHRQRAPTDFRWDFGSGEQLTVALAALYEAGQEEDYQGDDLHFIGFDELTHWYDRPEQVEYLTLSRLRPETRLPYDPFVVHTLNPISHGWIRDWVDWWIGEDGLPIREREGKLRWFIRAPDDWPTRYYVDTREEILRRFPQSRPLSLTFLPGRPEDNPSLEWDRYVDSLANLEPHIRAALRDGNWNVDAPDASKIWRLPAEALFDDTDDDFQAALRQADLDLFGGWDYGRAKHGLSWVCGALQPGSPPTLWIIGSRVWTGAGANPSDAAADRAAFLEGLDLEGLRVGRIRDAGDPSGRAITAGTSWYRELRSHKVPLMNLRHLIGEDRSRIYWNSELGRSMIIDLVQNWLNSDRLRIRRHTSTQVLLDAVRQWAYDVPEGFELIDVNREELKPRKDRHSHPGEALGYLCAFVSAFLRSAGAEELSAPSTDLTAHAQAMRAAQLMGRRASVGL